MKLQKPYTNQKWMDFIAYCNNNNCTPKEYADYWQAEAIVIPLAETKQAKINDLKSARDNEELSPISYGGFLWDFDEKAQMRINGAITVLGENTITWTSADNREIRKVTVDDLKSVVGAAAIRSNAVHVKYRELKARVEACTTKDQVAAIVW